MQIALRIRNFGIGAAVLLGAIAIYIVGFTPAPQPKEENTDIVTGQVVKVLEGGVNDVVITLAGDDRFYYVNRGLERGIDLNRFAEKIRGEDVNLHVIQRLWTPLDLSHRLAPVGRVSLGDDILYTDF